MAVLIETSKLLVYDWERVSVSCVWGMAAVLPMGGMLYRVFCMVYQIICMSESFLICLCVCVFVLFVHLEFTRHMPRRKRCICLHCVGVNTKTNMHTEEGLSVACHFFSFRFLVKVPYSSLLVYLMVKKYRNT